MARESLQTRKERVRRIMSGLRAAYPQAHCELTYFNPLELLVATILSAQCTDRQVNAVTGDLFKKYRTAADYAAAPPAEFEADIRRIGLYRNKAKNIQAACRTLLVKHGGQVPRTMEELTALGGVGRKTANVVLGNAFGINAGIVVDTHVQRVSARLDLTKNTDPVKIEQDLVKIIPREKWILFSHQIILHGRALCQARNPKCGACDLNSLCYAKDKTT